MHYDAEMKLKCINAFRVESLWEDKKIKLQ